MREGNVIMGVDEILKNFIEILETFGIGAKTNVGYGQLKYIPK
jgi:CRISPR/Cas system CMR subunit Cmr6 (Cas7 group RAMP superfamily)